LGNLGTTLLEEGALKMSNRLKPGSLPSRAQHASQQPGTFKKGHKKLGGRKRGTPNVKTREYKNAISRIFESDQEGIDGLREYLQLVALNDPKAICKVLGALLAAECRSPE
jgi:hypothetical protein